MKKTLLVFLIISFVACKKETVTPVGTPITVVDNLYEYRLDSLTNMDTAIVKVNGQQLPDNTNGYNIRLNKGDVLSFYFSGHASNGPKDNMGGFNFAVWKNNNALPAQSINYFYSVQSKIVTNVFWVLQANNTYSSVTFYNFRHILKGQYIAQ